MITFFLSFHHFSSFLFPLFSFFDFFSLTNIGQTVNKKITLPSVMCNSVRKVFSSKCIIYIMLSHYEFCIYYFSYLFPNQAKDFPESKRRDFFSTSLHDLSFQQKKTQARGYNQQGPLG